MAADSDGCNDLTTVVTCEGNLSDPNFAERFEKVVGKLNAILGKVVKVHKLEPWNSVRVTLSIPREAALRLRKLASEGSAQLRALGILSVQVEGDQVISLRIANSVSSEPQEIILQTVQDGTSTSRQEPEDSLSRLLCGTSSGNDNVEKVPFKSPNVVCPSNSVVPKVPVTAAGASSTTPPITKAFPFPFASMNQAIHSTNHTVPPPPPYPGKHPAPTVAISSPLLVNLLQNDGVTQKPSKSLTATVTTSAVTNRTVSNSFVQKPNVVSSVTTAQSLNQNGLGVRTVVMNRTIPNAVIQKPVPRAFNLETNKVLNMQPPTPITTQAVTSSPSALSNTSMKPNNNKLNSTIPNYPNNLSVTPPVPLSSVVTPNNLPPPPPYSVAISRHWESVVQTSPIMELTPSLTDLKPDDLEDLLPDLASSPPEIPEELTRSEDKRNFLINPLTGELEPQSSDESEAEELGDVFTGLPSPAALSDEDTNSTIRPDTTDQSDSETRSSHSDSSKHSRIKSKGRERTQEPNEKIKLRLMKLEKSEPVNSTYKVDVSFIQQPKKASTSVVSSGEELRVPPLHISLRGRNHAFITNKKKSKVGPDGNLVKVKARKTQEFPGKLKRGNDSSAIIVNNEDSSNNLLLSEVSDKNKILTNEVRKVKKFKSNHEHNKELLSSSNSILQDSDIISKLVIQNSTHYKEKQRRGSDSELARTSLKFMDSNGVISAEKKRRLSQSEVNNISDMEHPPILGSTNIGTIASLPQKVRKDKNKLKDVFKSKEVIRNKNFNKSLATSTKQQVTLPTGEIDMEAKFKQRLMEGTEKGIPRPPHRTEIVHQVITESSNQMENSDKVLKVEAEPPPMKEKSPEPDKCNTPDRKQPDLVDKQASRSPNSGAQGEDSGIESMDALSEKSPNQASQSPHADIPEPIKSKTQVPDMLDIEAQLAKMEGLNGVEDLNENQQESQPKLGQCCELTSALQDNLKQEISSESTSPGPDKEQHQHTDIGLLPIKTKKEEDLEPLPLRVTPPRYTYSNPEKGRGSESPTLSDEDSNSCTNVHKSKSLLEHLLIDIPDTSSPSSPSPATRSVRTRALSKLNSPELASPVSVKPTRSGTPAAAKRKRHESDSSNNSLEDVRNKKTRKCSENAAELIKACIGVDPSKINTVKKQSGKLQDESSDSDEPLIEKVRKTTYTNNAIVKNKIKSGNPGVKNSVNTRRSIRAAIPTPHTRSKGDKVQSESEALRRKTRSAVFEGDNKRKKEVK